MFLSTVQGCKYKVPGRDVHCDTFLMWLQEVYECYVKGLRPQEQTAFYEKGLPRV